MHPLPEGRQGHQGRLTALLDGALAHLEHHRAQVNELNVFPVADGDTGDNLAATLRAYRDGGPQGALLGARGNSGVILSQLLAGLAEAALPAAVARVRTASVAAGGDLGPALREVARGAELEMTPGAPPPWWWLIAAE